MIEIIIFAIIAFFVLKKLHSILGEEDDRLFFDSDNKGFYKQKIKDAEKIESEENNDVANEEEFNYLSENSLKYSKEISEKIDGFNLKKFQSIAIKVLEMVIKANNDKDKTTIKKFLSSPLCDVVCNSFDEDNKNNIILVECSEGKIENIEKNGSKFDIIILFKMKQINYTTDKNGAIIDGDKSEIIDVNEKWTFTHDFASKSKTWFVEKIEEY